MMGLETLFKSTWGKREHKISLAAIAICILIVISVLLAGCSRDAKLQNEVTAATDRAVKAGVLASRAIKHSAYIWEKFSALKKQIENGEVSAEDAMGEFLGLQGDIKSAVTAAAEAGEQAILAKEEVSEAIQKMRDKGTPWYNYVAYAVCTILTTVVGVKFPQYKGAISLLMGAIEKGGDKATKKLVADGKCSLIDKPIAAAKRKALKE